MDRDGSPLLEAGWLFAARRSQLGGGIIVFVAMIFSAVECSSQCATPFIIAYALNFITSVVTSLGVTYIVWSPRCIVRVYNMWVSVALDVILTPLWLVSCIVLLYWTLVDKESNTTRDRYNLGAFIFGALNTVLFFITSVVFTIHSVRLYRDLKTMSGAVEDAGIRSQPPTSPPPGYRTVNDSPGFGRRKEPLQLPITHGGHGA